MAKLDQNRMADSTKVNRTDDQHVQLEADLEDIFGIPDDTPITNYIFGSNPENPDGKPVQPDGSIRGVPVLKSASVESDPADAVGLKFDDGTVAKLLVFVNSGLKIYNDDDYPNEDWSLVANIESPGSGKLTGLTDYTGPADISSSIGKLLKVDSSGTGFDLQDPSAGVGVTTFIQLTDGPGDYGTAGQVLATKSNLTEVEWVDPPSTGASFVMFLSSVATKGWGTSPASYIDLWNWALNDLGQGTITDESTYLGNDGSESNKYFQALEQGIYEFSLWYVTSDGDERIAGTREWRLQGTNILGPATVGVAQRATVGFGQNSELVPIDGAKFLGTRMFTVNGSTSDLHCEVRQNSGETIGGRNSITFYAVLRRIK